MEYSFADLIRWRATIGNTIRRAPVSSRIIPYDGSRDGWKPALRSQFNDGPIGTDDSVRRVLEMVAAAVID